MNFDHLIIWSFDFNLLIVTCSYVPIYCDLSIPKQMATHAKFLQWDDYDNDIWTVKLGANSGVSTLMPLVFLTECVIVDAKMTPVPQKYCWSCKKRKADMECNKCKRNYHVKCVGKVENQTSFVCENCETADNFSQK